MTLTVGGRQEVLIMFVECLPMHNEPLMVRFTFKVLAALWAAISVCSDEGEEKRLWRAYNYYWARLEHFRGQD